MGGNAAGFIKLTTCPTAIYVIVPSGLVGISPAPGLACNPVPQSASNTIMTKLKGRGRLVPTRQTGIAYDVRYGLPAAGDTFQHGRAGRAMQWTQCSVHSSGKLPE